MINRIASFSVLILLALSASRGPAQTAKPSPCLTRFGQKEWSYLLKDLDPEKKKELLADKDRIKEQAENLRELLSLSCEAVKRGIANDPTNKTELGSIKSEVVAVAYDVRVRKAKTDAPYAWITDAQVEKYYLVTGHTAEFERFLEAKLNVLRRGNPDMAGKVASDDERRSAREFFAKMKISEGAAATLPEPFQSEAALQVRMQQAQFLARVLVESMTADLAVSDEDVVKYIAAHPEFDASAKRNAAAKILARAIAGEDFAALANQYSEDPGNISPDGKKNGGLYADVPLGMMLPSFEKASLALEPGQIAAGLVESDYGFHVIKLEKKSPDGSKYDV
ncbi:MAG TPA: peptidylprolyl isomerase, partial [Pyrinomonadaceae bacterium]|nr:peptidylprolyl isomerase [Pyrinomonadaceae bacterium]